MLRYYVILAFYTGVLSVSKTRGAKAPDIRTCTFDEI